MGNEWDVDTRIPAGQQKLDLGVTQAESVCGGLGER